MERLLTAVREKGDANSLTTVINYLLENMKVLHLLCKMKSPHLVHLVAMAISCLRKADRPGAEEAFSGLVRVLRNVRERGSTIDILLDAINNSSGTFIEHIQQTKYTTSLFSLLATLGYLDTVEKRVGDHVVAAVCERLAYCLRNSTIDIREQCVFTNDTEITLKSTVFHSLHAIVTLRAGPAELLDALEDNFLANSDSIVWCRQPLPDIMRTFATMGKQMRQFHPHLKHLYGKYESPIMPFISLWCFVAHDILPPEDFLRLSFNLRDDVTQRHAFPMVLMAEQIIHGLEPAGLLTNTIWQTAMLSHPASSLSPPHCNLMKERMPNLQLNVLAQHLYIDVCALVSLPSDGQPGCRDRQEKADAERHCLPWPAGVDFNKITAYELNKLGGTPVALLLVKSDLVIRDRFSSKLLQVLGRKKTLLERLGWTVVVTDIDRINQEDFVDSCLSSMLAA